MRPGGDTVIVSARPWHAQAVALQRAARDGIELPALGHLSVRDYFPRHCTGAARQARSELRLPCDRDGSESALIVAVTRRAVDPSGGRRAPAPPAAGRRSVRRDARLRTPKPQERDGYTPSVAMIHLVQPWYGPDTVAVFAADMRSLGKLYCSG